jgi:DME family drug/metabolite transporter
MSGEVKVVAEDGLAASAAARRNLVVGLTFGFSAALSYGTSQVLTRQGVSTLAPPLVGAFVALTWGTLGFALLSVRSVARAGKRSVRGSMFFVLAGLFSACGIMLMFQALKRGQVVIISPVLATNPLFTLLFAALLLRGVERITPRIVAGALLVVSGVVVLTVA